jgi:hypothetical protein
MTRDLVTVSGYAAPVWGGWVWILPGGVELHWTKSASQDVCEKAVIDYLDRNRLEDLTEEDAS